MQFADLRDAGDPAELAERHRREGADEIVLLDVSATAEFRQTLLETVRHSADRLVIPFAVGGGIRSLDDASVRHFFIPTPKPKAWCKEFHSIRFAHCMNERRENSRCRGSQKPCRDRSPGSIGSRRRGRNGHLLWLAGYLACERQLKLVQDVATLSQLASNVAELGVH